MKHSAYGRNPRRFIAAIAWLAWFGAPIPAETASDHTLWISVESTPAGALLYALDSEGLPGSTAIGTTPCTLAVDLGWADRWFRKRWELLTVVSPGGFCRPSLQPDGSQQLTAHLMARKDGMQHVVFEDIVANLTYPGPDWKSMKSWPTKRALNFALEPAGGVAPEASSPSAGIRRVVMAAREENRAQIATGLVRVLSDQSGLEVFVNDQSAGPAPVELLLHSGTHRIEVRSGLQTLSRREIDLPPDSVLTFSVPPVR